MGEGGGADLGLVVQHGKGDAQGQGLLLRPLPGQKTRGKGREAQGAPPSGQPGKKKQRSVGVKGESSQQTVATWDQLEGVEPREAK